MKGSTVRALRVVLLAVIVLLAIAYFAIPTVNSMMNRIFMIFSSKSVDNVMGFIRSYGMYAVAVSFTLMVFQSVAAPLQASLLIVANAAIWGWWRGAILSWSSALVGALACFLIARLLGRGAVEKLAGKHAMDGVEGFFDRYGGSATLVCRFLPFVPFDFISYAAGFTSTRIVPFLLATGIGLVPVILAYSYFGRTLVGGMKTGLMAAMMIFALTALAYLLARMRVDKRKGTGACEESAFGS